MDKQQKQPAAVAPTGEPLWSIADLSKYFNRSKASLYADIKAGRLDEGILITPRCRRWLPSKVRVSQ